MVFHVSSSIDAFWNITLSGDSLFPDCFSLDAEWRVQQADWSILGFLDREKIDKIANSELLLVIIVVIADQALTRLLMDDESSWNILCEDVFERLSIKQTYMNLFSVGYLLAFNNHVARAYRAIDLKLSIGEGTRRRKVIMAVFIVQCRSAFNDILGKCFLEKLDTIASTVHLKAPYHDKEGAPITIGEYLQVTKSNRRIICEKILVLEPWGGDGFNLDSREDEVNLSWTVS